MTEPVPYQCFISYVRDDNQAFDGVVDRLKRELSGRFKAATGTPLNVFLDRESIGLGERWRDKVAEAIASSVLFMPIITMNYFNSGLCRDEFSAFHSEARRRGVADLVLPVILAGADRITPDHPDVLVRAVAELNYQPIFDEFEAGYQSSEWKRRIGGLVTGLQNALDRAAACLSSEAAEESPSCGDNDASTEIDSRIVRDHIIELFAEWDALWPLIERVGQVAQDFLGRDIQIYRTRERFLEAFAVDLREPAGDIGTKASNLEGKARQVDAELRAFAVRAYGIDPQQAHQELAGIRRMLELRSDVRDLTLEQMREFDKRIGELAIMNVRLREVLRPLTAGARSLESTYRIILSWDSIDPSKSTV